MVHRYCSKPWGIARATEQKQFAQEPRDSLPEWSKGVDSSSTSASCVGSNPTAVISPAYIIFQAFHCGPVQLVLPTQPFSFSPFLSSLLRRPLGCDLVAASWGLAQQLPGSMTSFDGPPGTLDLVVGPNI